MDPNIRHFWINNSQEEHSVPNHTREHVATTASARSSRQPTQTAPAPAAPVTESPPRTPPAMSAWVSARISRSPIPPTALSSMSKSLYQPNPPPKKKSTPIPSPRCNGLGNATLRSCPEGQFWDSGLRYCGPACTPGVQLGQRIETTKNASCLVIGRRAMGGRQGKSYKSPVIGHFSIPYSSLS